MESHLDTLNPSSGSDGGGVTAAAIEAARARIASPTPDLADALGKGYEPHDIRLRGVFLFLITLVVTIIVVLAAMWGLMTLFVDYDRSKDPVGSPVAIHREPSAVPEQPSVEHNFVDREDMTAMREETQRALNSSGTSPTGRRYISINEAMDQVLPKLPVKPSAGAALDVNQ
jgi:hypothetical protein